jgi:Ser/Thr protein kinase RdoA (MazF antagonist)
VWLLQLLNHLVFKQPWQVMDNIAKVTQYIAQQPAYSYQVTQPVPTLSGQWLFVDTEGQYWRRFPFIEGTYSPEAVSNAAVAEEAARAYGAFARALKAFPTEELSETIPGFHDTDQRWAYFLEILEKNPAGRVEMLSGEIAEMYQIKPVFDLVSQLKKTGELPLRVTHNDTKAGNVLLCSDTHKALAVIDLDTVMPGTVLSDFGDMVRTFAPNANEDFDGDIAIRTDIMDALQRGFLEQTGDFLTPSEREHLFTGALWICGEQALRFLTDYIAGDVYYKIRYPEHNLVRARNQIKLVNALKNFKT